MRVAFLGTGMMGAPMARRLLAAGHAVTAWNRTSARAEPLRAHGAIIASSAAAAVADAELVITMLENGTVVERVLLDPPLLRSLSPAAVVVDMSSIAPAEARAHSARLRDRDVDHVDAPVSGGTLGAEAGTLAIMAGGDEAVIERVRPALEAMGRVTRVGPAGSGQLVKLANQVIVGITVGAVAEALLLVERGGGDPERAIDAMLGGFATSRVLEVHGRRMVARDFAKRGAIAVQLKDLRNSLTTAGSVGLELPITRLLTALNQELVARGGGDLDQAALFLRLEQP
jgi:3-hydroxyisobutyrate dehydrogenase-like beta-hydroxyacid dehydrogenase